MPPRLIVEIVGDTSNLEKSFARSSKQAKGFGNNMERAGRGAAAATLSFKGLGRSVGFASAAFLGGAGFVAIAKNASEAASNLNEQTSKSAVVFGDSQRTIQQWSLTSANALGLARDQAIQAAAGFGALLRPMGQSEEQASATSVKLTQLAADLASFSNTSVADALQALSSGLIGEIEPLRRYGVVLSEAAVQQRALKDTGKESVKALTAQEKVTARLELIFKNTEQAQGDFARTSGGLANQERTLQANLRDLSATLGQALNPAILDIVKSMNKWLGDTENQKKLQDDLTSAVDGTAKAVRGLIGVLGGLKSAFDKVHGADPFKGASGIDLVKRADDFVNASESIKGVWDNLGGASFPAAKEALDRLADSQRRVADGFTLISEAQASMAQAETGTLITQPVGAASIPTKVGGSTFLGRPLTAAEKRSIALAGSPENVQLLKEEQAAKQRALDFALKQFDKEKGNTKQMVANAERLSGEILDIKQHLAAITAANAQAAADAQAAAEKKAADAAAKVAAAKQGRIARLAFAVTQAGATADLRDDLRAELILQNEIRKQIAAGNHTLDLQQQLFDVTQAITGTLTDIDAKKKLQRQKRANRARSAQFKALGLTATGEELAPTKQALKVQLTALTKGLAGAKLDKPDRVFLAGAKKLLNSIDGINEDVRRKIQDMFDTLSGKNVKGGIQTAFRTQNVRRILEGAGLSPRDVRRASAALSRRGPGGTIPGRGTGAFGIPLGSTAGSSTKTPIIHTTVEIDGRQVALATTRHQQKIKARNPSQKRGAHAP